VKVLWEGEGVRVAKRPEGGPLGTAFVVQVRNVDTNRWILWDDMADEASALRRAKKYEQERREGRAFRKAP
jgi:hypothetical protein